MLLRVLILMLLSVFFACNTNAQTQYRFIDTGKFDLDVTFNVVNDSTLSFADPDYEITVKNYISKYFSNAAISSIIAIKFDSSLEDDYVVFLCENEKQDSYNIAFAVTLGEDNRMAPDVDLDGGYGHSCAGSHCGCCSFIKTKKGTIIGCYCNNAPALCPPKTGQECNHTVTTRQ